MNYFAASEDETRALAAQMAIGLRAGDIVLFEGQLGAGKTTFIRGILQGLGYLGPVRSPTFNLIQTFETEPPVMHADLYRLKNASGIGLEEYFESHLCLIEWPDRLGDLVDPKDCRRVSIGFENEGRSIEIL